MGFIWGVGRSFQLLLGDRKGVDGATGFEGGAFDGVAKEFGGSHVWIFFLWGCGVADQERVADGSHSKRLSGEMWLGEREVRIGMQLLHSYFLMH